MSADTMSRCVTCGVPCHHESRFCPQHDGLPINHWQDAFSPRQQQHIAFCQHYAREFAHGAPGHLDYMLIAALIALLEQPHTVPSRIQIVSWDEQAQCHRDIETGVRVEIGRRSPPARG